MRDTRSAESFGGESECECELEEQSGGAGPVVARGMAELEELSGVGELEEQSGGAGPVVARGMAELEELSGGGGAQRSALSLDEARCEAGRLAGQESLGDEATALKAAETGSPSETSREPKADWRKTGQKKGRPRKRGRRSEEAQAKSEAHAQGQSDLRLKVHNEKRDEPEERTLKCVRARKRRHDDKQRARKAVAEAEKAAAGGGEKPKPKKSEGPKHVVGKVEQLDPAVYARMLKLMGKDRLEEYVRNAGNKALGRERGRRYKGPGSEAEMMVLLRGLRQRRGEGIQAKIRRLHEELCELEPKRSQAAAALERKKIILTAKQKADAEEVLAQSAEKGRELAEAREDFSDVKKAKLAYKQLWSRRHRKKETERLRRWKLKKKQKFAERKRQWCQEVILKAKARATKRADLRRRMELVRHMRVLAAEQRKQRQKLNALSGTGVRQQQGDKFQRVTKQTRFEAVLVKLMVQRSTKPIRSRVRVANPEKAKEERDKLVTRVKTAVRCGIGHKTQLLKDFVKSFGFLWDEVERLQAETLKEVEPGKGVQTYEELLRPEWAQVHRRGQKPYAYVWPQSPSDDDMVTATESEAEDKAASGDEEKKEPEGKASQGQGAEAKEGEGKDPKTSEKPKKPKPKSYKKKLAEMRERARKRQKAKVAKKPDAQSSQSKPSQRKMRGKELGWGEKDNCVCGPKCVLPPNWAQRVMDKLLKLPAYRTSVVECLKGMMALEDCVGCSPELGVPCMLGDKCEDVVKICLAVRPHSLVMAELLEEFIYPVKQVLRSLMTLERALEQGTVEELEEELKGYLGPANEGQSGQKPKEKPRPLMESVALEEKYGKLMGKFREREQDHPINNCSWCDRRLTKKQMAFLSLKSLDDADEKRMQDKTKEALKARIEERLESEGEGGQMEDMFPMGICTTCYKALSKESVSGPMVENGFYTDPVPAELADLNVYELMMVCLAKPFYTCVRLKTVRGRGKPSELLKATRGNVVHLRIPLEETLNHVMETVEPVVNNPGEFLTIYADVKTRAKNVWRNLVDLDKVVTALDFLKRTNRLYRKVKVDRKALAKLKTSEFVKLAELDKAATVDENLEAEESEEEVDEGAEGEKPSPGEPFLTQDRDHRLDAEFSMLPLNADKVAVGQDVAAYTEANRYRQKDIKGEPLRAQKERELDLMSFPNHFPRGRYGLFQERKSAVRPAEYFRYRIQNRDARWRRDQTWLHTARFFKVERQVMSGVYASMHMGAASAQLNREQMMRKLRGEDDSDQLAVDMSSALACMKGTPEYWKKKASIPRTMDDERGPATWFVTLSCAESEWAELRRVLVILNEDMKGVEKLTTNELCALDPVTVSEFFQRRMDAFLSEVLLGKKDGPLGHVTDYFWRLEYQARGAPHAHMKLWVEGAPVLGQEGVTEEQVLDFIQRHETCTIPTLEENKELHEKVKKFQMHSCNKRCWRFRKGKGKRVYKYCRFGFPRAVREEAVINSIEKTVKESSKGRGVKKLYELERKPAETNVNNYNPAVLLGWNANVDVQFVGESSMVLNKYITGYITKAEKGQTQAIWDAMGADKTPAARLTKLMFESNKSREVGTYEIADDLLGHSLHGSSVSVEYLGVGLPGQRMRALKKYKELQDSVAGELFQDNLIDVYYPQRSDELESLSLYECKAAWRTEKVPKPEKALEEEAVWQNHLSKLSPAQRTKAIADKAKSGKLSRDGKSRMKRRTKRVLVGTRYIPATKERAEEFFHQLLMLHVPFRDEMELKRDKGTWREAFEEWEPLVPVLKERRAHKERLQKAEELKRKLEDEGAKEAEAEEAAEEDPEWPCQEPSDPPTKGPVSSQESSDYMTDEGLAKRVATLNQGQRAVYDKIMGIIGRQLQHEAAGTVSQEQVLEFISGGAGTGKRQHG